MIASYDPDHHATIMILEGPKIIGCEMVEMAAAGTPFRRASGSGDGKSQALISR